MFKNTNKNISLEKFHQICIEESIPFVSYNLPYKKKTITLVQYSSVPQKIDIENELENNTGFIIAPFDRQDNENAYILRPDAIYETKKIDNKDVELILRNKINFKTDAFQDELNKFDNKISFLNNVNKIIENIHSGDVQKVVLSRVERVERLRNLSLTKIFNEFIKVYPNAFVYFFYLPEVGSWMGATPEPLIKLNCHEAVVESIAATKWAENDLTSEIKWTNKEYDEQKIVTKYIEDLLKDFEIIESKKEGPYNYKAGQITHLKTDIIFEKTKIRDCFGKFLRALHPTPSICGYPKNKSYEVIKKIESHNRLFYGGILGPINILNTTELYVNIRCMRILENNFELYIGAGITSESKAESEWEETEYKKQVLLSVINKLSNAKKHGQ